MPDVNNDRFQMLTDAVYQRKYNDKARRLIKNAKLRTPKADIHDIWYIDKRPLNCGIITGLASCRLVDECRSIVFRRYLSYGKTFLSCAMAKEACRGEHKTRNISGFQTSLRSMLKIDSATRKEQDT